MPRKPSQTMLTFVHATRPDLRAAVHVLPAPTAELMTHYTTHQHRDPAAGAWRPLSGASYSRSLLVALRSLRRAGYSIPAELLAAHETTV